MLIKTGRRNFPASRLVFARRVSVCAFHQPQQVFQGVPVVPAAEGLGCAVVHGLAVDGEHGGDAGIRVGADGFYFLRHAARDDGHRHALPFGPFADAADHLAPDALAVEPALAGDDQIAVLQLSVKVHQIQHRLNAGAEGAVQKRQDAGTEGSGGPGAGHIRYSAVQFPLDHGVQGFQLAVQEFHHGRVRPFLGAEDIRRPSGTVHGVVNVTHGGEIHSLQQLPGPADIDMGDLVQGAAGGHESLSRPVQKPDPQGRRAAAAAVVGAAAAQAQQDLGAALLHRMADLLAHAVGAGNAGVPAVSHQGQPCGGGHFDHGPAAIQPQVSGFHVLAEGALDRDGDQFSAADLMEAVHGALAAIRHGNGGQFTVREYFRKARPGNVTDLSAAQKSLEGI